MEAIGAQDTSCGKLDLGATFGNIFDALVTHTNEVVDPLQNMPPGAPAALGVNTQEYPYHDLVKSTLPGNDYDGQLDNVELRMALGRLYYAWVNKTNSMYIVTNQFPPKQWPAIPNNRPGELDQKLALIQGCHLLLGGHNIDNSTTTGKQSPAGQVTNLQQQNAPVIHSLEHQTMGDEDLPDNIISLTPFKASINQEKTTR